MVAPMGIKPPSFLQARLAVPILSLRKETVSSELQTCAKQLAPQLNIQSFFFTCTPEPTPVPQQLCEPKARRALMLADNEQLYEPRNVAKLCEGKRCDHVTKIYEPEAPVYAALCCSPLYKGGQALSCVSYSVHWNSIPLVVCIKILTLCLRVVPL